MKKTTSIKNRTPYYDNLKLLLIYLVVLGHFVETAKFSMMAPVVRFIIYSFHMPLFIFISGHFFDYNNIKKGVKRGIGFLGLFVLMKIVSWIMSVVLYHNISFSLLNTGGMPWFLFALAIWCIFTPVFLKCIDARALLIIMLILALVVGYDSSINSMLVFSRIIVFWPFFLMGILVKGKTLKAAYHNRVLRYVAVAVLLIMIIVCFRYYDQLSVMNPMLSGQNPYVSLGDYEKYGILFRSITYLLAVMMSISVMLIIPNHRFRITDLGERTISVYFYDVIVYPIAACSLTQLHFWQYCVLAILVTWVFSLKVFYRPIKKIIV